MRKERGIRRHLVPAVLGCLLFALGLAFGFFAYLPVGGGDARPSLVEIPRGSGFVKIVRLLDEAGYVTNKPFFYALAVIKGAVRQIRAGEYEFSPDLSPAEIIDKLVQGKIKFYPFTIPEDITTREIAARLAAVKLVREEAFLALAKDERYLASLGIKAGSAEGYLYPETYRFDRTMGAEDMMRAMVRQFWKVFAPELRARASELGMTVGEVLTLASLIGKETGYGEEKPLISAVFHNRLRLGMKLQCDPTAVYGIDGFSGAVKKHHLLEDHPYNTYRISGLPPGPIGNPAMDSIRAALYPARADYLYFVSNNEGKHIFSTSLEAHNRAVSKYQISKKKQ